VDVTGPSHSSGPDSLVNWDKDRHYSRAGLSWCRKKEVELLVLKVKSPFRLRIVEESGWCNMCTCSGNGTQERAVQDLLCLVDLYLVYLI